MKSKLGKCLIAIFVLSTFIAGSGVAEAYYGHHHHHGRYYHNGGYYGYYYNGGYYNNCRWVHKHWSHGVLYPARRVCW